MCTRVVPPGRHGAPIPPAYAKNKSASKHVADTLLIHLFDRMVEGFGERGASMDHSSTTMHHRRQYMYQFNLNFSTFGC